MPNRTPRRIAALPIAAVVGLAATFAAAGERQWSRQVQGPQGRGFVASGSFAHAPGQVRYQAQRVYDGGLTAARSNAASWGDGTITRQSAHTGVLGASRSRWSTVARNEDGVTRSHGASTSGGRSFVSTGQASRTEDGLVVSRSVTTASGRSASRTRTYPRLGSEG